MANVCKICRNPQKLEIDALVANGTSLRNIAERFSTSLAALSRHVNKCIPLMLQELRAADRRERAVVVETELNRASRHLNKLLDACDDWLTDPDDPSRYTLEARANELTVVYDDWNDVNDKGQPRRKRESLSNLLKTLWKGSKVSALTITSKSADPRDLIVKTAGEIKGQLELFARLQGLFQRDRANESDRIHDREVAAAVKAEVAKMVEEGYSPEDAKAMIIEAEPEAAKWLV